MSDKGLDEAAAYLVLPQSQLTKILQVLKILLIKLTNKNKTKKSHTQ